MKINIDFPTEDEFYEFKTSLAELDKGIEAITAMLNKHGKAEVYYGVANDGEAIGLNGQLGQETSDILPPLKANAFEVGASRSMALACQA